jgi:hypothetical protein
MCLQHLESCVSKPQYLESPIGQSKPDVSWNLKILLLFLLLKKNIDICVAHVHVHYFTYILEPVYMIVWRCDGTYS